MKDAECLNCKTKQKDINRLRHFTNMNGEKKRKQQQKEDIKHWHHSKRGTTPAKPVSKINLRKKKCDRQEKMNKSGIVEIMNHFFPSSITLDILTISHNIKTLI